MKKLLKRAVAMIHGLASMLQLVLQVLRLHNEDFLI